ncbi:hypothetical protein V1318_21520, partial [Lysobacter sp. CCNWLW3]|uniref:hypothetical protein n=1 Tax=Lysobacter sp. CCNWLW3 TaxID=3117014 RepID=UPI002FD2CBEB
GRIESGTKSVDDFELCCKMRGPADGTAKRPERKSGSGRKKVSQGVDGREICCKMCGSLGHFGDEVGTRR